MTSTSSSGMVGKWLQSFAGCCLVAAARSRGRQESPSVQTARDSGDAWRLTASTQAGCGIEKARERVGRNMSASTALFLRTWAVRLVSWHPRDL